MKIMLRALEPHDIELLYKWENDQRIWNVSNTLTPFSKYALAQFIEQSIQQDIFALKQLRLMIEKEENNTVVTVGMIDLFDYDPFNLRAGIGILIDENFRKRGIGKEALNALIDFVKKNIPIHQLYCNISSGNADSISLFTALGFVQCAEKKHWLKTVDGWDDELMFQLML